MIPKLLTLGMQSDLSRIFKHLRLVPDDLLVYGLESYVIVGHRGKNWTHCKKQHAQKGSKNILSYWHINALQSLEELVGYKEVKGYLGSVELKIWNAYAIN